MNHKQQQHRQSPDDLYKSMIEDNPELQRILSQEPDEVKRDELKDALKTLIKDFHDSILKPLQNMKL